MSNKPPPGKRLIGDWKGMMVETVVEVGDYDTLRAAGSRAVVGKVSSGLTLLFEPCKHCGAVPVIKNVPTSSVRPA